MDSYDLFGEDGSGMLEGLADLAGTDTFTDGSAPPVAAAGPREPERSYRQAYNQASAQQEGSLQKMASFGSGGGVGGGAPQPAGGAPAGGPVAEYSEYGAYPPRPRLPHPPHPSHHPPHHPHPPHPYPSYHAAPEPIYSMPEHPGIGDIGGWPGAPGPARGYPPAPQSYRHPYDQQKMHQYPPQQAASMGMQAMAQGGGYMQRQPHYAQPPAQQMYTQQQSYPGYNQMHPQGVSRMGQHAPYHQQIDLNAHQYGHVHGQQTHPGVPPHQSHQAMPGHQGGLAPQPGMQGHPPVHMHHPAAPAPHSHHVSPARQPPSAPAASVPPVSVQPPPPAVYAQPPHHTMTMNYQPHQLQRTLDVNVGVANQYGAGKPPGMDGASPQYRTPFPQLSPQMSPRAQMSPRPQAPQMSPRPAMSPAKSTSASPHGPRPLAPSPAPIPPAAFSQQSTLQALEQMVMPGGAEYSYPRNPSSPAVATRLPVSPQPWSQSRMSVNGSLDGTMVLPETVEQQIKPSESMSLLANAVLTNAAETVQQHSRMMPPELDQRHELQSACDEIITAKEHTISVTSEKLSDQSLQENNEQVLKIENDDLNKQCENSELPAMRVVSSEIRSVTETLTDNISVNMEAKTSDPMNKPLETSTEILATSALASETTLSSEHVQLPMNVADRVESHGPTVAISDVTINDPKTVSSFETSSVGMAIQPANRNGTQAITGHVPGPTQHSMSPSLNVNVLQNPYESMQELNTVTRNCNLPINIMQSNLANNMSPNVPNSIPSNLQVPINLQPNITTSMQPTFLPNVPNMQSNMPNTLVPNSQSNIQTQNSMLAGSGIPAVIGPNLQATITPQNLPNSIQQNIQSTNAQPNASPNLPTLPPAMPGMPANIAPNLPAGMSSAIPPGMSPNIPPGLQHGIMMGTGMIPHPGMGPIYPTPVSHHQERAALQQQLREIFCMPSSPENTEKVRRLQERLAILQQHESNEKCNGGPACLLQNPIYGATMVESPQVSSTTGRGRGKGPPRPRKPRTKKDKPALVPPAIELPVSEDCVTAGTGIQVSNVVTDDLNGENTTLESNMAVEMGKDGKPKKPRTPRKPRERKPRTPKEPKTPKPPREPKERKKREPKDPNTPKRKRVLKKEMVDVQADTTTNDNNSHIEGDHSTVGSNISTNQPLSESTSNQADSDSGNKLVPSMPNENDENTVTDFDDIPVSKIAIKDLLEEAEAKREREEKEIDSDSTINSPLKKRGSSSKRRPGGGRKPGRKSSGGRRKKRGGIVPESDGEPDDIVGTPPPSPPAEGDCDSSKRRSARHTQRKKYTDDVMLRLSDDEYQVLGTPRQETRDQKPFRELKMNDTGDIDLDDKLDGTPKPNYMYINTTDEDSMIVQHVLASRMGKRERKPDPPPAEVKTEPSDDTDTKNTEKTETANDANKETEESTSEMDKEKSSTESQKEEAIEKTEDIKKELPDDHNESDGSDSEKKHEDVCKIETASDLVQTNSEAESKPSCEDGVEAASTKSLVMVDIEEFYVKYRNFSYLHCEWKTEEELYKGDKRIFSKIKRFKQKQAQQLNIFELLDDEPFNPDYVEVERILDVSEHIDPGTQHTVKHYLAKWKGLQYEESTWELEEDVDADKIKQFQIFNDLPPKEKWKYKRKPNPDQWVQIKESPMYKGGNTLRPYQLEGLNWLLFSWHNNRNCVLADEMGLGKTIQSLTFVNSVWEYGIRGPFLVIAPLSTIPNWQREFESWTDMNVIVYHGSQQSKSMIQEYEFCYKNDKTGPIKELTKFNVLITTFEIIVTDFQDLKLFNWRLCVIDEAHRLKNRNCKLLEGLRQLHLEHRVLLSGTPLQNNVNELFSLLNFLEPSQFSSCEAFLQEFGQLKTESEVLKLQALLKPMMLRRLKEDVEKSLAPKEETIVEVELTNIQKKYYRGILERNFSFLSKGTASAANIPNLMNTMMELRKCCIHPYLLNGAEEQIQFDYKQAHGEDNAAYYKALIQSSGKMVLVDKLLPKLKAGGHRVLVFSQMVRCLDILEDYLMYRKYPYERIDGRIRGNLRQEAIDRFSKPDSDRFVFLLCTKAGGLGINLTAADTVIIYDSDWNPQNDLQAQARCHRIGQQKMVKIYRLICQNTYEREMFDKASMKLGLDKAILQSMNTTQGEKTGTKQLSKKEIEDLLKKGAYGAVMDEDNAGDKFCEEDIEMILARRTTVIQMESEKGSTFSKASFSANNQRCDIDIRDPDFWNKWAKKAEIDTTEKKEDEDLIVTEPRRRTLIKRYGHDDGNVEMSDTEVTPDTDDDGEGIGLRSKKKKDKFGKKRKYNSDDYIPRHEGVPIPDEDVVYGQWARSECFKIERGLLTFGWARWEEILDKNQFRKGWTVSVIEDCARIIVLYCLRHYKGDEKIRNFIWDLIEPCENGEVTISRNHSGLHNPVPRGRNAKKKIKPKDVPKPNAPQKWEDPNHWSSAEKYDCEAYLESSYKKHLFRHANKVLLRVRMMYYIKHEVIGEYAQQLDSGVHASAVGMRVPRAVESAPPRAWWDSLCDVSLLVGTYLHGYENYLAMRSDPQLCFVDKLGPPDDAECSNIKNEESGGAGVGVDEDGTDEVSSGAGAATDASPAPSPRPDDDSTQGSSGPLHQWPSMQDLNTRLRRLITSYQRNYKKEELKMQQRAKKLERRERMEQLAREEAAQWRWQRADEEAFRRTVASYGVEFDPATKSLRWGRFRALARLDSKSDDALTDYLKAFMAMCKRQCGLAVGEAELPTRADLRAEPIGEERAIATLERIDLLRVLREEVAPHPSLEVRLALCEPAADTPPWWQPAKHDKLLVLGVCKHGLGDTYHKLFCDPKLPFADCARKFSDTRKLRTRRETRKQSTDDEEDEVDEDNHSTEERPALRRSKRNSNTSDRDKADDDTDALSELESLARLGRTEPSPPPTHWFSERALETRLHHIAHAVQNGEWPAAARPAQLAPETSLEEHKRAARKQHIAIDVETDRAKLHALLSTPPAPPPVRERRAQPEAGDSPAAMMSKAACWDRDDASSDSSRRSTPAPLAQAPPPAHQRPAPSPASVPSGAVDLSAPLDLSEAQDFTMSRRVQDHPEPPPAHTPALSTPHSAMKGKLDDTLSKLLKRKNVPEPEVIVGKEKKRRKLDEIVLGLSAAKGRSPSALSPSSDQSRKNQPVLPNVTVTPAAPPRSSPAPPPTQKPFSVTVTSVPSPHAPPKELSSFLQQSLEQAGLMKTHKSGATSSAGAGVGKPGGYSHEAKVHKWLAEQATLEERRRRTFAAPRISADEHIPVVHRITGKKLLGHKAPQLKHLHQWIAENPMYDIDPKWTEGVKDYKLPLDTRSQRPSPLLSTNTGERKKGRPPTLDASSSVSSTGSSAAYPSLSQNLAGLNPSLLAGLSGLGAFDSKTLAATLSNLTGFDSKTLSSFDPKLLASLSNFDPKNNPLLMPFNNMPNMLGNMAGGNMFANLAGLGLPGFSGVDMASLGIPTSSADGSGASKTKGRKSSDNASSSSKNSSGLPSSASSQFPFVFPNPNLLYPQLGLSGLNPFSMQSGMSAYDALAQCGLLNGSMPGSSAGTTAHSTAHSTSRNSSKVTPSRSTSVTSATATTSSRHAKSSLDRQQQAQLQQLLLPPDTYLLDSLQKQVSSYEAALKADKRNRESERRDMAADLTKSDKRKASMDTLRNYPPEFAAVQERLLKSSKGDKKDVDISKMLFEQMASGALSASLVSSAQSKRAKESESKDAFEKLSKTSAEYIARSLSVEETSPALSMGHKRPHEPEPAEPENLVMHSAEGSLGTPKKQKESEEVEHVPSPRHHTETQLEPPTNTGEMDLEDLIAPSTVIKSGPKQPRSDVIDHGSLTAAPAPLPPRTPPDTLAELDQPVRLESMVQEGSPHQEQLEGEGFSNGSERDDKAEENVDGNETTELVMSTGEEASDSSEVGRKGKKRGRKPAEEAAAAGVRRELRSSAGRQAAAAAARHAAGQI